MLQLYLCSFYASSSAASVIVYYTYQYLHARSYFTCQYIPGTLAKTTTYLSLPGLMLLLLLLTD